MTTNPEKISKIYLILSQTYEIFENTDYQAILLKVWFLSAYQL